MTNPNARGHLATLVALSSCFHVCTPAADGFSDGENLTRDGEAVVDRLVLEILRVRDVLGTDDVEHWKPLTLVAAALAGLDGVGPIPDGEVAAAAAATLEALHAAAVQERVA